MPSGTSQQNQELKNGRKIFLYHSWTKVSVFSRHLPKENFESPWASKSQAWGRMPQFWRPEIITECSHCFTDDVKYSELQFSNEWCKAMIIEEVVRANLKKHDVFGGLLSQRIFWPVSQQPWIFVSEGQMFSGKVISSPLTSMLLLHWSARLSRPCSLLSLRIFCFRFCFFFLFWRGLSWKNWRNSCFAQ